MGTEPYHIFYKVWYGSVRFSITTCNYLWGDFYLDISFLIYQRSYICRNI